MMHLLGSQAARFAIMASVLVLGGCARTDVLSDLQVFVNEVKSRPGAEVEPVPTFEPYEAFVYSAASMRSPFEVPLVVDGEGNTQLSQDVEPDFARQREPLESQSLSEIAMVGMMMRGGVYEALLERPEPAPN